MQNTSHAVMAQRIEAKDSLDDFPTPPWATRALIEHVVGAAGDLRQQSCLEPACGAGHMVKVLAEYFGEVTCFDVHDYKYAEVANFLTKPLAVNSVDWVVTNPPFRLAEEFVLRALAIARKGVAILARTVFIESVGRHERLYRVHPPAKFAQFTERVPMVKGRLDRKASTATGYGWLVWEKGHSGGTALVWIPQCRKAIEKVGDYELPPPPVAMLPVEINAPVRPRKARAGLAQESLFGL
jgi:predicted RNA methylase